MILTATQSGVAPDYTPLVTLIGSAVSEVIGFAIYALKSAKENTRGGIKFETTMAELANPINLNQEEDMTEEITTDENTPMG